MTTTPPRRTKLTGKQVTALRARMQINHDELADALGVHPSSVYRWEAAPRPALRPAIREVLTRLAQLDDDALLAIGRGIHEATEAADRVLAMQRTLAAVTAPAAVA